MVSNYVLTSLRTFGRTKTHTVINVVGLTLGFLCALIIFQKVRYERSFDAYHPDGDRIFRIVHEDTQFGQAEYDEGVPYPLVDALRLDFPEIENVTIVDRNFLEPVLTVQRPDGQTVRFKETAGLAYVEQDYFTLFPRKWLRGNPETALAEPRSAVLSESVARKYFGDADPIGRTVTVDNRIDLTVTGLVADSPRNTALPLDLLISFNLGEDHARGNDNWGSTSTSVQCYLKLPPALSAAAVNDRLVDFLARHRSEEVAGYLRYFLQPLPEIHFDTRFSAIGGQTLIDRETIWALSLIGLFLLVTACINFVNLNTVLVFKRAKEVGIRKVLGGTPRQIMAYFMTETALITLVALVFALALANPVMYLTRSFIGEGFQANPFTDPLLAGAALLAAAALTLLSGLYPAYLLSRLRPTIVMRNTVGQAPGGFMPLRRGLVIVQFAISQVLIICTLAAMLQMRYLYSAPLGYDTEALVEFEIPRRDDQTLETLKNTLHQSAAIRAVTFSNSGATSSNTWGSNFYYLKDDERLENETQVKLVAPDYIGTYGMTLVAGTDFTPTDSVSSVIVNEALVRTMGYADPAEALGTMVEIWGHKNLPITGVVRDFNTNSLHQQIEPTIIIPTTQYAYVGTARVNTSRLDDALTAVEKAWNAAFPAYIFDYEFLDDRIARFYEEEQTLQQLIQAFALIAIAIGCIGLFGLISYTTSQRVKEIGIRKVLGASATDIVGLFTREFVVLVVLGFALAAPAAYLVMDRWLDNFAYRIGLGAGLFAAGFLASLLVALGTVGFKTYRAAVANPVEAIKQN